MKKVLIVGAGKGGSALLKMFHETKLMDVVAIVDRNEDAPGIKAAREMGIQTSKHWRDVLTDDLDIIVEVTGDDEVFTALRKESPGHTVVIPGDIAYIIAQLVEEKEQLIATLKTANNETRFNFSFYA
ncbi:Acetaldehyde dehydrogenase [Anoxybacillus sp. BCO1]|nr:Acetaldehyde dehydrogenase [Anoxybacillus sp. BCO1]